MLSRIDQAVFGALRDQAALEMRNSAKYMEHELTSGGCRVDPFLEADQVDPSGLEVVDGFQKFLERAPQALEADDGEGALPVLGRKVEECEQLVAVLDQAFGGPGILGLVTFYEQVERLVCILTGFCLPDVVEHLLRLGLGTFG
jgi:hypothetical protein